ncbi:hypothetical protein B0H12DRAFT_1234740 [Mycena haematopus]|nr:hypothetical protein B0H12DRAFT_1234740 [Mycena haematopus]
MGHHGPDVPEPDGDLGDESDDVPVDENGNELDENGNELDENGNEIVPLDENGNEIVQLDENGNEIVETDSESSVDSKGPKVDEPDYQVDSDNEHGSGPEKRGKLLEHRGGKTKKKKKRSSSSSSSSSSGSNLPPPGNPAYLNQQNVGSSYGGYAQVAQPSYGGYAQPSGGGYVQPVQTSNSCGNPECGKSFICAKDYNQAVQPLGYRGV